MNLTEIFVNRLAKDSKVVTIDSLFNEDKVKKRSMLHLTSVIMCGMERRLHTFGKYSDRYRDSATHFLSQ